jgi:2-haloacid dehalogenase
VLVVFDVNETLSDLGPMGQRFVEVGAPEHLARLWFGSILRDGFALTAAGSTQQFATIGRELLGGMLAPLSLNRGTGAAVEHIMTGFLELPLHADVAPGVAQLREAGHRLVTLTNGSTNVSEELFRRGGIRDHFEALLSVDDAGAWKPNRRAYEYAGRACNTELADMLLVAVHPWDIDGAARAGMETAWLNRSGSEYPSYFTKPTHVVTTLPELAARLRGDRA